MKRSCIIVGAGPGISMAVARRFAREGNAVGLIARRQSRLEEMSDELTAEGTTVAHRTADAADHPGLQRAINELERELGPVESLLFNVGAAGEGKPTEVTPDVMVSDFSRNVGAALVSAQAVAQGMRDRGEGSILLTGGGFALSPWAPMFSMGVGKAALRNLASSLAQELEPDGVRVATITVAGMVEKGTFYDADRIAEKFYQMHSETPGEGETDFIFREE